MRRDGIGVTGVRINSGAGSLEVEVTVTRDGYSLIDEPRVEDVPKDIRQALLDWLRVDS